MKNRKWLFILGGSFTCLACGCLIIIGSVLLVPLGQVRPTLSALTSTAVSTDTPEAMTPTKAPRLTSTPMPSITPLPTRLLTKIADVPIYPGAIMVSSEVQDLPTETNIVEKYRIEKATPDTILGFYIAEMPRFDWTRAPNWDVDSNHIAFGKSGDVLKGLAYIAFYEKEGFIELHITRAELKPTERPSPTISSTPTPITPVAIVKADVLNVRGGPGTDYDALGKLNEGDQVEIVARTGDWLQVLLSDGSRGWVSAAYVETSVDLEAIRLAEQIPPTPIPPTQAPARTTAQVVGVIDGDTIEVSIDGQTFKVRYIGIDAPETKHPDKPVEPYALEASARNEELVGGKMVELEKDVSETDKYGRLLRYVWIGDLMVNAELVRLGYAQVSTYPPDVKYADLFIQLQQEAHEAGRGLWGVAPPPPPGPTSPPIEPTATPQQAGNCDPAYPDVCIPPPPPDLDCKDVHYRNFKVLPPDPHGFDGDKDGIGCER